MRILLGLGLAMSLACISAAESPAEYQSYFGARVDSDQVLAAQFDKAARRCEPEASDAYRGSPDPQSYMHIVAMRNCLARHNFIDRGAYAALPITLGLDHFLDR